MLRYSTEGNVNVGYYLVADVLSHLLALLFHFAVFLLASLLGLLDGFQTLALGLLIFVFGVAVFAVATQTCQLQSVENHQPSSRDKSVNPPRSIAGLFIGRDEAGAARSV